MCICRKQCSWPVELNVELNRLTILSSLFCSSHSTCIFQYCNVVTLSILKSQSIEINETQTCETPHQAPRDDLPISKIETSSRSPSHTAPKSCNSQTQPTNPTYRPNLQTQSTNPIGRRPNYDAAPHLSSSPFTIINSPNFIPAEGLHQNTHQKKCQRPPPDLLFCMEKYMPCTCSSHDTTMQGTPNLSQPRDLYMRRSAPEG